MDTPKFLSQIDENYCLRRKGAVVLSGDIFGLFPDSTTGEFACLTKVLRSSLERSFHVISFDVSTGITIHKPDIFFAELDEAELRSLTTPKGPKEPHLADVVKRGFEENRGNTLVNLTLLKMVTDVFNRFNKIKDHLEDEDSAKLELKPLCVIVTYAGAMFPEADFERMSELDRQRLVFFLQWISDPAFVGDPHLFVLINRTRSEINSKIIALPTTACVEIDLPDEKSRSEFVSTFLALRSKITFDGDSVAFSRDTAGMNLQEIKDLLEYSSRSGKPISRSSVVEGVNRIVKSSLGDIVKIVRPSHGVSDIIGYDPNKKILANIFRRCEDPETAISSIIVSGSNGVGKTYQFEAFAPASGRVVLAFGAILDSALGGTEKRWELLELIVTTLGNVLIVIDEAHTAFPSIHGQNVHETTRHLSGNIIKMMGDPKNFGKILWVLMTSRPDLLDPDIKSRSPVQIPIFDLEGPDREEFVREAFKRKGLELSTEELAALMSATQLYSARDYRNLVAECLSVKRIEGKVSVLKVITEWQASSSIKLQREFQELLAAQHCSYPKLVPDRISTLGEVEIARRIEQLKITLRI